MNQVTTYRERREVVVARAYAAGGCPIHVGKLKCGETKGLDIIMDFHKLYQEKMSQIDVSAGGDTLQAKVDLQQEWINDLTEQNRMLAKVIEELESEAIGRVTQLEEKLKTAAKSFGEDEGQALADRDKKIKELEEALKAIPVVIDSKKPVEDERSTKLDVPAVKTFEEPPQTFKSEEHPQIPKVEERPLPSSIEESLESEENKVNLVPTAALTPKPEREEPPTDDQATTPQEPAHRPGQHVEDKKATDSSPPILYTKIEEISTSHQQNPEETSVPIEQVVGSESSREITVTYDESADLPVLEENATVGIEKTNPSSPKQMDQSSEGVIDSITGKTESNHTKPVKTPTVPSIKLSGHGKLASRGSLNLDKKSVHLVIEHGVETTQIVEPEKNPNPPQEHEKPELESVPVVGTNDSIEIQKNFLKTPEEGEKTVCICSQEHFWEQMETLKEENRMLREGGEIKRLKDEIEEKMKRILQLNEENRALNNMINVLRENQGTKRPVDHPSDSEPMSSDSEYCQGLCIACDCPSRKSFPEAFNKYDDTHDVTHMGRTICVCNETVEERICSGRGRESPSCNYVYKREDKGKFVSDSSSTVCNLEMCPILGNLCTTCTLVKNPGRARAGNDFKNFLDECHDSTCNKKDKASNTCYFEVTGLPCNNQDEEVQCALVKTENDDLKQSTGIQDEICLNLKCFNDQEIADNNNNKRFYNCEDLTCRNKECSIEPQSTVRKQTIEDNFPVTCDDATCQVDTCSQKNNKKNDFPITCDNNICQSVECPEKSFPITCENDVCQSLECPEKSFPITCDNDICQSVECPEKSFPITCENDVCQSVECPAKSFPITCDNDVCQSVECPERSFPITCDNDVCQSVECPTKSPLISAASQGKTSNLLQQCTCTSTTDVSNTYTGIQVQSITKRLEKTTDACVCATLPPNFTCTTNTNAPNTCPCIFLPGDRTEVTISSRLPPNCTCKTTTDAPNICPCLQLYQRFQAGTEASSFLKSVKKEPSLCDCRDANSTFSHPVSAAVHQTGITSSLTPNCTCKTASNSTNTCPCVLHFQRFQAGTEVTSLSPTVKKKPSICDCHDSTSYAFSAGGPQVDTKLNIPPNCTCKATANAPNTCPCMILFQAGVDLPSPSAAVGKVSSKCTCGKSSPKMSYQMDFDEQKPVTAAILPSNCTCKNIMNATNQCPCWLLSQVKDDAQSKAGTNVMSTRVCQDFTTDENYSMRSTGPQSVAASKLSSKCTCKRAVTAPNVCPCVMLSQMGTDTTSATKTAASVCICSSAGKCVEDNNTTQKPIPPVLSPYGMPGINAQQSVSFGASYMPQGDGGCARVMCETCACITFPMKTEVQSGSPQAAQSVRGICPRGICEQCACTVCIPDETTKQTDTSVKAVTEDIPRCAICGCELSPSDIIKGQSVTRDAQVHVVPPAADATTSFQGVPLQLKPYGQAIKKEQLCLEMDIKYEEAEEECDCDEDETKPTVQGDTVPMSSGDNCPDELCTIPCECKVVPSETTYVDSDKDISDSRKTSPDYCECKDEPTKQVYGESDLDSKMGVKSEFTAQQPNVLEDSSDGPCLAPCAKTYQETTCTKKTSTEGIDTQREAARLLQIEGAISRCICKSQFCKIVPDPEKADQLLCVDKSQINLDSRKASCICNPECPEIHCYSNSTVVAKKEQNDDTGSCNVCTEGGNTTCPQQTAVYTVKPIQRMGHMNRISTSDISYPSRNSSSKVLSKEQEYAGLSRKEFNRSQKPTYIAPKKVNSAYVIQDENNDDNYLKNDYDLKNADLKLVIADLKGKLLDAEDRIEELKSIKTYDVKDNDTALIAKYSQEIDSLKKALKWSKKEKEEYEHLKQKIKLLEEGKGDTDNITTNLQTAEEKMIMKTQLKKLSRKNKCYEEIVQLFKKEMSVMSDELLTLQEVLNVTNVTSQEENNKLITAILQLRRINDGLVGHLCAIEKQVVLENQINQINEARINELQQIIGEKNNDLSQHDEIIQDMRRKLGNATKQNADLKKTIKNLTDTVIEIQEGIKSVETEQRKNKADVSVVESRVCLASGDLQEIKACMEQKNKKISDLENQLKNQEISLILATKELGMLNDKKNNQKDMIKTLKEQLALAEKKTKQVMGDYQVVAKKLQDYTSLDHMKNYELGHYKGLVEEMKLSLMQMNNGLERCEATNIHFYDDLRNSNFLRGKLQTKRSNLSIVFEELKKSMADMKRRLSEANFKGGLIEEELLKVKESHMSQIQEEVTENQKELQAKILSSVEEQTRLNQKIEHQKAEIEKLKQELLKEKDDLCCCKRSVSELKNEKMNCNAQKEISHLKSELNNSLQKQRLLNEENNKLHTQMVNLRKKLTVVEHAYEVLKQEHEETKIQLKKSIRDKEYLVHKNEDLTETVQQMKSTHEQLEKQCRTIMKRMSEERSWIKTPMQQPFSPRRYGTTPQSDRRSPSPTRSRRSEKRTADSKHRASSPTPWRCLSAYLEDELLPGESHSHRSKLLRNISYDSNSSPYSTRTPSPRSNSIHEEAERDEINLNDWFSPNYKETDTDADELDDEPLITKVHLMTAQVQEANKKWQQKMNKEFKYRTGKT